MMEELLRQLVLLGSQPELESTVVELWPRIGNRILSSDLLSSSARVERILSLLIFVDPIIKWNIKEWPPLKKMTHLISRWCDTVGQRPDCFSSLVRFLRTVGFSLVPEYGIAWLHSCMSKIDDHKNFLERSRIGSSLSELLYDAWSKNENVLRQNPETLKWFIFLVEKLAEQGESMAIRLQSKLLNKS